MAYYDPSDIARSKQLKPLSDADIDKIAQIKTAGATFHDLISDIAGPSRDISLAKTKVEEAIMWAVKGITA